MNTQYIAFSSSGGSSSRSSGGSSGFSSSGSRSGSSGYSSGGSTGFSSSGSRSGTSGTSGWSTSGSGGSSSGWSWTGSGGTSTGTTPREVAPRVETSQPFSTNNYYSSGYNGGSDMFWNYMWWNAMFNRPTYVVGQTVPAGYYMNGGQVYPNGWTVFGSIISLVLTLTIVGAVLWIAVKLLFRR